MITTLVFFISMVLSLLTIPHGRLMIIDYDYEWYRWCLPILTCISWSWLFYLLH